jgi:hypothetical protein
LARGLYRAEEELGVEDKFFKDEDALRAVTDKFA